MSAPGQGMEDPSTRLGESEDRRRNLVANGLAAEDEEKRWGT
jgi:hypothetical protein